MSATDISAISAKPAILSSGAYGALKWTALIAFPALGAAYYALAQIWDFPYADSVLGTLAIISTLIGALIGISTNQYNNSDAKYDGQLSVDTSDSTKDLYSLNMNTPLDQVAGQKSISLKVDNSPKRAATTDSQ